MKKNGYSLVEILVALMIFSIAISALSSFLVNAIKSQNSTLASQELVDNISYALEYMSRTIRMAKKDLTGSCITAKSNYAFEGQCLKFVNYENKCQEFCLDGTRLREIKEGQGNYLTSESLEITAFSVWPSGSWDQDDNEQPMVTIFLKVNGSEFQTTISQRNLDVRR